MKGVSKPAVAWTAPGLAAVGLGLALAGVERPGLAEIHPATPTMDRRENT